MQASGFLKKEYGMEALKIKEKFLLFLVGLMGVSSVVFSVEPIIYAQLMFLAFFQNVAFSLVSRSRNRNSNNYHLIAAVLSNGVWFLTMSHMISRGMPMAMLFPFLAGTTLGSLYGAHVSMKIESWLGLTADVTKDPIIEKTECLGITEKTETFIRKYLLLILLGVAGLFCLISAENMGTIALLMSLSYIQSVGFGLSSRAKNRGSQNYLIIAKIFSVVFWFLTFGYLVINKMPLSLFVPYTIATVFGSITGTQVSMFVEKTFGFNPDSHVKVKGVEDVNSLFSDWWLFSFVVVLGVSLTFLLPSAIALPVLFLGTFMFALETTSFTVASRAGNRNNMIYHLYARLFKGIVWFLTFEYAVIHNMSFDIFVPVGLGMILGEVFGQKIGVKIESKIGAVMDTASK